MSDPELHARATALFLELRSLPPSEHAAAAARAANGDERLRREVLSLLEHDVDEPASPGETPAFPAELGPYRVLAPIGQGGTGRVFLAEQLAPIRRRVAIKIVPQAASSAELAARFDFERRALERTEHPHIARILDAGRTRDGLPYLVMEYVEGVAITAYCDAHELAIEERIRLFLGVADAVHHAHQRGVIHRDIKPANVLVGEIDGRAVPRVLDFGIAKFVGARADEMGPPTSGLPVGTPAYMAPEQTGVGVVDTRADVYALGALLYELVAGRPPIEAAGGDLLATLERVRHDVPRPASSVAGTSVRLHAGRSFLRDLDCILAKALEKDPERRYPSVEALVDDLGRLQRCEPIAARAPSFGYRAARFAQRNRVLVGALGLASAALLLGLFGLALGLMEARRQRRAALEQMDAQAEVNRFLTEDLLGAASPERSGRDATVLDLLQRASQRIDERFAGRPLVAASIHQAVGGALGELGEFDAAERHLERALALRRASMGADSPDAVRTEITAASLLGRRERYAEARPVLEAAVTRARLFLGADAPELYTALNDLGVTLDSLGLPKDAEPVLMRRSTDSGGSSEPRTRACSRRSPTWPACTTVWATRTARSRRCSTRSARRNRCRTRERPCWGCATTSERRTRTSGATRRPRRTCEERRHSRSSSSGRTIRPRSRSRATWRAWSRTSALPSARPSSIGPSPRPERRRSAPRRSTRWSRAMATGTAGGRPGISRNRPRASRSSCRTSSTPSAKSTG